MSNPEEKNIQPMPQPKGEESLEISIPKSRVGALLKMIDTANRAEGVKLAEPALYFFNLLREAEEKTRENP